MKTIKLVLLIMSVVLSSILIVGCSPTNTELYVKTDAAISSLATTDYNILDAKNNTVTTEDGLYAITPIGKLINVKIEKEVSEVEYTNLKEQLQSHYSGDNRVHDVYICGGGTIMIDCRN